MSEEKLSSFKEARKKAKEEGREMTPTEVHDGFDVILGQLSVVSGKMSDTLTLLSSQEGKGDPKGFWGFVRKWWPQIVVLGTVALTVFGASITFVYSIWSDVEELKSADKDHAEEPAHGKVLDFIGAHTSQLTSHQRDIGALEKAVVRLENRQNATEDNFNSFKSEIPVLKIKAEETQNDMRDLKEEFKEFRGDMKEMLKHVRSQQKGALNRASLPASMMSTISLRLREALEKHRTLYP